MSEPPCRGSRGSRITRALPPPSPPATQFRIPYINLVEPILVHMDSNKGLMRMDYYQGMDTYIFNTSGNAFAVTPVMQTPTCFNNGPTGASLVALFPQLSLFTLQAAKKTVVTNAYPAGVECDVWAYSFGTVTPDKQSNATSMQPDNNGARYAGDYFFYVTSQVRARRAPQLPFLKACAPQRPFRKPRAPQRPFLKP